jgi:hypothetical protein
MFDRLEPSMVKETLDWLFQEAKNLKRTDRLAINYKERTARFGRTYNDNYEIKYDEILNIIHFMLKNSYVKIGCQDIALQVRGLPQGAPPFPPLARLVCIKREWEWKKLVVAETKLFNGMRFMDDVCVLFFYHTKNPDTKKEANKLKENFYKNCYYPQWNLKKVETNIFLSTEFKWKNGKIDFRWANKNRQSIISSGKQKIVRFIHAKSFTSDSIKNNSLYAQILRVTRNSNKTNMQSDLKELCTEYGLLGYKHDMIELQKEKILKKFEGNNNK